MRQLPYSMYENLIEQRFRSEIDTINTNLDTRVTALEVPTTVAVSYEASPNYIPNSHPEYSVLAYGTAGTTPAAAGDTNHAAFNWFYQLASDASLQNPGTVDASGNFGPLVGDGHSLFGTVNADGCIWDRTNGTYRLGSSTTNYDIACPLPTDFVAPGQRYYVYFEAALAASDTNIGATNQFYCGFWDNTGGQQKWIEGSDFTPTASIFGVAGARTLEYKIHARTDAGSEILSTAITVTTAPAALTADSHVRLSFTGAPGFIEYTIYRKDGSNYYRVGQIRNSIDLQFFDIQESGSSVVSVAAYPTVTGSRPQAYAKTVEFEPAAVGAFTAHTMTIQVPLTYNKSLTGNLQQWFRFGLSTLVNAAGDRREVVIRKLAVSEGYGAWSRSPRDMTAASGPSTAATSAPTGGNPTGNPPMGGSGGPSCLVLETEIETINGIETLEKIKRGSRVIYGDNTLFVTQTRIGTVQFVWDIELEDGRKVPLCSDTHRWIRHEQDKFGIATSKLKIGDTLLTKDGVSAIIKKEMIVGQFTVKQITIAAPHVFWAGGIASHNRKEEPEIIIVSV